MPTFTRLLTIFLCIASLSPLYGFSPQQGDSTQSADDPTAVVPLDSLSGEASWQVGVYHKPPFMIKESNGQWDGISIRLWEDLAEAVNVTYDYKEIDEDKARDELVSGNADVIPAMPLEPDQADEALFTQHYYLTTLGVASSRTKSLTRIGKSLFTWQFFQIVIGLSILLTIVGAVIYLVEKTSNEKQFGGERNWWHGIGAGFWWAGVTMTTIGYGDKAPTTTAGRAIALLWMLIAMGITASLTAAIVSAVNDSVSDAKSIPEDLRGKKTAVIEGSPYADFLDDKNVKVSRHKDPKKALRELNEANEKSFFIHDVAEMRYYVNEMDNVNLRSSATELLPVYYALAISKEHADYLPHLDESLMRIITQPEWLKDANSFAPNIQQK